MPLQADSDADGSESDSDESPQRRPPVPISICVKPELRSVIITGPNTGGKTATLKVSKPAPGDTDMNILALPGALTAQRKLGLPRDSQMSLSHVRAADFCCAPHLSVACAERLCMSLQAFGLAVLMAKAGVPVPAAAPARLPPFSMVLADIGDEQSLFASLSTFSGHLKRIQVLPGSTWHGQCSYACHR